MLLFSVLTAAQCAIAQPAPAPGVAQETDFRGKRVTLQAPPKRIVAMGPSVSQTVAALGAADRLVGRSRFCTYPAALLKVPEMGGITDPSLERILAGQPDLILGLEFMPGTTAETLENARVPVALYKFSSLEQTVASINSIGRLLGPETAPRAVELTQSLERRIEKAAVTVSSAAQGTRLKVLLLVGNDGFYSAGRDSYLGAILRKLGAENLADQASSSWPELSRESVLEFQPELIVVLVSPETLAANQDPLGQLPQDAIWKQLDAVRTSQVVLLENSALLVPGPRLEEGVRQLSAALYPALFPEDAWSFVKAGKLRRASGL